MMIRETHRRVTMRSERGSALILVVLLTLILSATAIVALRNVARTAQGSSVYRTAAQSDGTSDSADRLFLEYAGGRAGLLVHAMQEAAYGEESLGGNDTGGVYGGGEETGYDLDGGGTSLGERRRQLAIRGVDLEFEPRDLADDCSGACTALLPNWVDGGESGLFAFNGTSESFETRRKADWRVRIRDLSDGFPAPGYSDEYCFKTALVASEARVGEPDPTWTRANNVATSRHAISAALGPVECGYN